ncbi:MAG TPA: hypothetical protein VJ499_08235 [Flavisolibacter sp.]|nr:hypothetical protein [Flavisolibacter sp.]
MKPHNGMRPQDVVVLLKIISKGNEDWQNKDLANELHISPSEVSESLNRSMVSGLVDPSKKKVFINSFIDFLVYGLKYVFPVQPGALVKGMETAHSAPLMKKFFSSQEHYVWADIDGKSRGQAIQPLYPGVSKAAKEDPKLYELLALTDVLRVGKVREMEVARKLLNERMKKDYYERSYK